MEQLTRHSGVVIGIAPKKVQVRIEVLSACASCQAHARCGFAEKKDKIVDIPAADWQRYQPGDRVNVVINTSRGLSAVFTAYVLPAAIMLAAFVALHLMRLPEPAVALITLAAAALYGLALYLMRNQLQQKYTFRLEAENNL